uniref:ATP synthase F0 subunit 8 n=1 Tax=Cephea cephea TaxID=880218 RepID=A0AAU6W684_9CNID
MPQLDVITFINQYLWIIGSITALVVLLTVLIIPKIKTLVEIRISNSSENISFVSSKQFSGFKKILTLHYGS